MPILSAAAILLILRMEGVDQPSRWPGQSSGVTIGVGYDLGAVTEAEFRADWCPYLAATKLDRLSAAIGKRGQAAHALAPQFADIRITRKDAVAVFRHSTAPRLCRETVRAFPGAELLPPDAFGALCALVYNRGSSMGHRGRASWSRRREMREVRELVADYGRTGDLGSLSLRVSSSIRSMTRVWRGTGIQRQMTAQRGAEANLFAAGCCAAAPILRAA